MVHGDMQQWLNDLSELLINHSSHIQQDEIITTALTQAKDMHNIEKLFELFQLYLYNIMKHVSNERKKLLNNYDTTEGEIISYIDMNIPFLFSQFEKDMCTNIPMFINILFLHNQMKIELNLLYYKYCIELMSYIKNNCDSSVEHHYNCKIENVVYAIGKIIPSKFNDVRIINNFNDNSKTFIQSAINLIKKFNSFYNIINENSKKDSMDNELLIVLVDYKYVIDGLKRNMDNKNSGSEKEIISNEGKMSTKTEFDILHEILLFIFRRLMKKFLNDISQHYVTNESYYFTDISSTTYQINKIFESLCVSVHPLLFYIKKNNTNKVDIEEVFGLYYTYCSDWTNFINIHCAQSKDTIEYKKIFNNCIIYTMTNRLKLNFKLITNTKIEDYNNVYLEEHYTNLFFNMVENISTTLTKRDHLNPKTKEYKWTKFQWICGKFIMTNRERYDYKVSNEMSPLSDIWSSKINIYGMDTDLKQAYDLLLMWNIKTENVWNFHKTLMKSLKKVYNKYVFEHAYFIKKYIDGIKVIHDNIIKRFIKSFKKYKVWTQLVYTYIGLSEMISTDDNIVFTNIDEIKSQMQLENFITEILEKNTDMETLNNISIELENTKPDKDLKFILGHLLFQNFERANLFMEIFKSNISESNKKDLVKDKKFEKYFKKLSNDIQNVIFEIK